MKKRFLILSIAVCTALTMGLGDAEAKRLGGGRSVGKQSGNVSQREAAPQAPQSPSAAPGQQGAVQPSQAVRQPGAAQAGAAQPARNRWLGPIAGLAAGLGLAALASHLGFGEELANIMMIALLAMAALFIVRMIMARRNASKAPVTGRSGGLAYAGVGQEASVPPQWAPPAAGTRVTEVVRPAAGAAAASTSAGWRVPEGFDADGFVRNAKTQFVRLQAAFDAGRSDELRDFATPEMFEELQREIAQRGSATNRTDVVTLDAQLLGIESTDREHIASVRFQGALRENPADGAEPFDEVWNLVKPVDGSSGWVLAGIQQLS